MLVQEPERRLEIDWKELEGERFMVRLALEATDRRGLYADLATAVSATGTDIRSFELHSSDGHVIGELAVEVGNLAHLQKIIKAARRVKGVTEVARRAIDNVGATSEKFGGCEWLTADDAEEFLDRSTLTIQRTGAGSCLIFDGSANTMMVAVIAMARDTQVNMMNRNGGCKHVPLPEFGREAFGEHSCNSGNANAVVIYVWKGGKQASILFAPRGRIPNPDPSSA